MEITYDLTPEDLTALTWHHSTTSSTMKRYFWVGLLLPPLMCLLVILMLEDLELSALAIPLVFAMAWILSYSYQRRRRVNRYIQRLVREGRNRGTLGPHKMVLEERGLFDSTDVSESRTSWIGIERVEENERYIFLYKSALTAYVVPKRAFNDQRQAQQFFSVAKAFQQRAESTSNQTSDQTDHVKQIEEKKSAFEPPTAHFDDRHLSPVQRLFSDDEQGRPV
jgi:hypothetical protein